MTGVGKSRVRIPQLVEEFVCHGIDGGQPRSWGVLQQLGNQINRASVRFAEYLWQCQSYTIHYGSLQMSRFTLLNGCGLICGNLCSM